MRILISSTIPTATPRATPIPITTSMPAKQKINCMFNILFALKPRAYGGQNDATILKSKGKFCSAVYGVHTIRKTRGT